MIHIDKRITSVIFYQGLDLTTAYVGKNYISLIRQPDAATGTGYNTNVPTAGFNSLTVIAPNTAVDVIVNNMPSGGFDLDNGIPPAGGGITLYEEFPIPAGSDQNPVVDESVMNVSNLVYSGFLYNDASGQIVTGAAPIFQLDGGPALTLAQFNDAIADIPTSEYRAGIHKRKLTFSIPSGVAGMVTITYQ
jgi:hypothetical protein